ncbi:MAG: HAD family phosphatase [Dorea sp.]|nr:HAD family phosphatase [Dorea sp.]
MIKGAIFDVDGTLLDSMEIWEDAGIRYLRRIGVMPEEGLSGVLYSMTMSEGAEYVKEHYHLPFSIDEIIQGVLDTVRDFYFYEVLPKSGAKELLSWIKDKNITIAAATASDREHVEAAFERLGIAGYFGQIFTCREVGSGKRHPLIYEKAAAYLGWKPEEILVFEDAFYALMTAKKAGFRTVGIYDRFSEGEQEEIKKQADVYLADLIKGPEILAEKEEIRL